MLNKAASRALLFTLIYTVLLPYYQSYISNNLILHAIVYICIYICKLCISYCLYTCAAYTIPPDNEKAPRKYMNYSYQAKNKQADTMSSFKVACVDNPSYPQKENPSSIPAYPVSE